MKPLFCLIAFVLPSFALADQSYTVRKGDTLLKIVDREMSITDKKDARRYQWVQKIRAKNPNLAATDVLEPGDVITLPDFPAAGEAKSSKIKASAGGPAHETPPAHEAVPVSKPEPVVKSETLTVPAPAATTPAEAPKAPAQEEAPPTPPVATAEPAPTHEAPPPAPPAPVPPPPEEHKSEVHHAEHHGEAHSSLIGLQPRFQTQTLEVIDEATHEEAKLTAASSMGVDLQFVKVLNEKAHLLAQIGTTSTTFKDIEGPSGVAIDHDKETQLSLGLGFAAELTESLAADLMLVSADRTFIVPTATPNVYELKGVRLPGVEMNLSLDMIHTASSVIGVSAIAEYIAGLERDGVEYKPSFEPIGALYWASKGGHDRVNYRANLTYKKGHQHTSLSEQHEEAIILGVMVHFPL